VNISKKSIDAGDLTRPELRGGAPQWRELLGDDPAGYLARDLTLMTRSAMASGSLSAG
jgi:hypothetical protein